MADPLAPAADRISATATRLGLRARVLAIALLLMLCGASTRPQATPIVSVGSATVNQFATFTIPISITGALDLTSWQFDLSFGSAIVRVTGAGVTEHPYFTQNDITVFVPGVVDNVAGRILGAADALIFQPALNGNGVLADIEFTAMATGTSQLTLSNVFLNLLGTGFAVTNGSVCVQTPAAPTCQPGRVPEPGTLLLLVAGLLAVNAPRTVRSRTARP